MMRGGHVLWVHVCRFLSLLAPDTKLACGISNFSFNVIFAFSFKQRNLLNLV